MVFISGNDQEGNDQRIWSLTSKIASNAIAL